MRVMKYAHETRWIIVCEELATYVPVGIMCRLRVMMRTAYLAQHIWMAVATP